MDFALREMFIPFTSNFQEKSEYQYNEANVPYSKPNVTSRNSVCILSVNVLNRKYSRKGSRYAQAVICGSAS